MICEMRRLALALLFLPALLQAQQPGAITLDRLFGGEFSSSPGAPTGDWLDDGKTMITARGGDITTIDAATGESKILVPKDKLPGIRPERLTLMGDKLLIFANSQRVWRTNTRGDFFLYEIAAAKLTRVGPAGAKSELMFAKLSPNGKSVGYVFKNNLYAHDLATGKTVQLTKDGTDKIVNGTFDWVYEEEFSLQDGWRWSPDGTKIAFWQLDTTHEPMFTMINNTESLYPTLKQFPYPKAGDTNADVRVGVVPAAGGATVWMEPKATSESGYIARMDWAANSSELLIQMLNRRQDKNEFLLTNATTGKAKPVLVDTDEAWVDVVNTGPDGVTWVGRGTEFVFYSERSGWRHLHAATRDGKVRDLTPGDLDVDWSGVTVAGDTIYFTASPEDSTQRHLFRTSISNPKPVRVTPSGVGGGNSYNISPTGAFAVYNHSSLGVPGDQAMVSLPDHKLVRVLNDRTELRKKVETIAKGKTERLELLAADGKSKMDAFLFYPPDFDPSKKYPVFFEVYGEPWGATAVDSWGGFGQIYWWMLAQKGYIVATVDNRGTPCLKGREWRKVMYKQVSGVASADHAAAAQHLAKLSYVDPSRIGIWGWSGGGVSTLHALFRYPDVWSLGISVAPVPDVSIYDTIYTEKYRGLPKDNPEAYQGDSAISFAKNLKGSLLIIHGTGDDNVHYQGTEKLINELVKHNKPFTVMPYPNRSHGIFEGEGTTRHLYELMVRYLTTNMPPGGR